MNQNKEENKTSVCSIPFNMIEIILILLVLGYIMYNLMTPSNPSCISLKLTDTPPFDLV